MINVIENTAESVYEVRFSYNLDIIDIVKQIPGRRWMPEGKVWVIPRDRLGFLINQFKNTAYENELRIISTENIDINEDLSVSHNIPNIDLSDVNTYVAEGCNLFEHQLDCLRYAIDRQQRNIHSGFILADQPGTGKTLQVMNLALYNKEHHGLKHCLIIACVNSAKYNWQEDIFKHTNGLHRPYILGTRLKRDKVTPRSDTGSKEKLADLQTGHMYGDVNQPELPFFLLVNIEAFRYKQGKKYLFVDEVIRCINEKEIAMIALDEIHRNTSSSSTQGTQILKIKNKITQLVEWIPMTGTPITSKPTDVYLPLRLVDGHHYTSFYTWSNHFCIFGGFGNHEIVGYKNIPELKQMLEPHMLRRLKSDVLDLPPKIQYTEYIENTPYQNKLYNAIQNEIKEERKHNPLLKTTGAELLLRLRQVNGSPELVDTSLSVESNYLSKNAKLSRLLELIDDIVANGEKVVIFSNWVKPLSTLYKFISKKHKTCCYLGTMKPEVREKHKLAFISNPEYSVMLGTVGALGTSHTLTVARNIIFYDEPWNPADREQCEDRCHRPGTSQSVNR